MNSNPAAIIRNKKIKQEYRGILCILDGESYLPLDFTFSVTSKGCLSVVHQNLLQLTFHIQEALKKTLTSQVVFRDY